MSVSLDLYFYLDDAKALAPLGDILDGEPLLGFHTFGSILFAEDMGVPSKYHSSPSHLLGPRGRAVSIIESEPEDPCSDMCTHDKIEDALVARLKQPVVLPAINPGDDDTNAESRGRGSDDTMILLPHTLQEEPCPSSTKGRRESDSSVASSSQPVLQSPEHPGAPLHHPLPSSGMGDTTQGASYYTQRDAQRRR